jgi:hypothetical protein
MAVKYLPADHDGCPLICMYRSSGVEVPVCEAHRSRSPTANTDPRPKARTVDAGLDDGHLPFGSCAAEADTVLLGAARQPLAA